MTRFEELVLLASSMRKVCAIICGDGSKFHACEITLVPNSNHICARFAFLIYSGQVSNSLQ